MKGLIFAIIMIITGAFLAAGCDESDGSEDAAEEETVDGGEDGADEGGEDMGDDCPGGPPPGAPCDSPGQTCEYSTACGPMHCWCQASGSWSCTGGHYCDTADVVDVFDIFDVFDVPGEDG